jgi:predicted NBD/HSP70 family sugar kinase
MVRGRDGLVRLAPNLEWTDVPFGMLLADELGTPVRVGNDADLGVLAEHVRGSALGCVDVVYLAGHSGIGAGVLVGGRPLSGTDGYAGEVGHVVVNPDGAECHCGSRGCWETECGEERLLELAGRPAGGGLDAVREVAADAGRGEPRAVAALDHVATWLGRGTGNIVNTFNPEAVIMGGALAQVLAAAPETVRAQVEATALPAPRASARLLPPAFGLDSSLLGAAELAFEPLLADPLLEMSRLAAS